MPKSEFNMDPLDLYNCDLSGKVICLLGGRGSGKSWVIRNIMQKLDDDGLPFGAVFSKTEEATGNYKKFYDDIYIHYDPDDKRLEEIVERGKMLKSNINISKDAVIAYFKKTASNSQITDYTNAIQTENNSNAERILLEHLSTVWETLPDDIQKTFAPFVYIDPRVYIVYDDCGCDKDAFMSPIMKEIFMNGRHIGITFVFAMQAAKGIPNYLRDNVDYLFIFNNCGEIKYVREAFTGDKIPLNVLKKIHEAVCKDFKCLVIRKTASESYTDSIWFFKASNYNGNKLGNELSKKYCKKYLNSNVINTSTLLDSVNANKNGTSVTVRL